MIPHSPQLDLPLELLVPQALPADSVPERISHHRLLFALVPFETTPFLSRFLGSDLFQPYHALRKTPCEFASVVSNDRFRECDSR